MSYAQVLTFYDEDDPNGTPLGSLTDEDCEIEVRPALWEKGGEGAVTMNIADVPAWFTDDMLVKYTLLPVSEDPIFAWWLRDADESLISAQEQGGELVTFSGDGVLEGYEHMRLWHSPAVDDQPSRGSADVPGKWWWLNEPYGAILTRVTEEGQAGDYGAPLADYSIDFTRTHDSDGVAWPNIDAEFETEIGSDGLAVMEQLREAGDLFVIGQPSLLVQCFQSYGRDLTGALGASTVRLDHSVGNILTELSREGTTRGRMTHLLLRDKDGNYSTEVLSGYSSGRAHHGYFQADQTNDDTTLNKIGQEVINASRTRPEQVELEITPGLDPANGRYLPGPEGTDGHVWIGDSITLHTGTGPRDFNAQTMVVVAIRITAAEAVDDSTTDKQARSVRVVLELNYRARSDARTKPSLPSTPIPDPPTPGTPGTPDTVVAQWHFDADNEDDDDQGYLVKNVAGTSPWSSLDGGSARANLQGALDTPDLIPASAGTAYGVTALLKNRWPLNPTDGVVLRLSFLDTIGDTLATHYSNATVGVDNWTPVTVGGTAPANTTHLRLRTLRGPSGPGGAPHHSMDDVIITATGTGTAATPGDIHPDLAGTTPGIYAPIDHRDMILSDASPTVNDDEDAGLPVTTWWAQLDDPDDPTEIIRVWILADNSSGAARWLPLPTGSDGSFYATTDGTDDVTYTADAGSAHTIEDPTANVQDITLTENATFTMPDAADGKSFVVRERQDGTGGHLGTYDGVLWGDAGPPDDRPTGANKVNFLTFHSDGTEWYGLYAGASTAGGLGSGFTVDAGTPTYDDADPSGVEVSISAKWGIDGSGDPYFNSAGVTSGEEAALMRDPEDGTYFLRPYNF